ncbi:uncharacterized protein MONBRDRAFT_26429 [Monosiga brevicollis MX1]|uniref:Uncharacterized protein n=1 Tax=Monosiga brevicollis TaxID=81824 RepID=A9V2C4_MONBE|nr:uncharacterized protein MONBRDRAFT_26429 [Monosiga brevicollis MX1]EDQ88351.1 predicted protein [Monosiga brevicollis MX1]|eukprot:XP_001746944.1 hypothetical protein [Monosiga brevicollis MX1]
MAPRERCACGRADVLLCHDPTDKAIYCAECWQAWLDTQSRPDLPPELSVAEDGEDRAKPSSSGIKSDDDDDDGSGSSDSGSDDGVSNLNDEPELEGRFIEDTLYLIDRSTHRVYHSERDEQGRLRPAGILEGDRLILPQAEAASSSFPWEADANDHCETPYLAYAHIAPLLRWLAKSLGKTSQELVIYDPYFCAGSMRAHLARLGFETVINECRDFYADVASGNVPDYDVLVTNPPFSTTGQDHVALLCQFLQKTPKPFCVVQPNYVYTKAPWAALTQTTGRAAPFPFYLTPRQPRQYVYETPPAFRPLNAKQRKTSPFVTLWYCRLPAHMQGAAFRWMVTPGCKLPLRLSIVSTALPDNFKDSSDRSRRKNRKDRPNHRHNPGSGKRSGDNRGGAPQTSAPKKKHRDAHHKQSRAPARRPDKAKRSK